MSNIFGNNSNSDDEVKINHDYAKNYNTWRKKEELNRLKTKYGEVNSSDNSDSSSSSDDDDENIDFPIGVEKDFFKTLTSLRKKDPKIYNQEVRFFDETPINPSIKKKKSQKPLLIHDYERNMLLQGDVENASENEDNSRPISPTYVEEQKQLKESLQKAAQLDDDENLFEKRQASKQENEKNEAEYAQWLADQNDDLKELKDSWTNDKLDDGEKFLRDYILNKRFLDNQNKEYVPTYDEIVHDSDRDLSEDEQLIDKQEEFEHKYNYRFEEPDQEFIKQYPRTLESSLRQTDNKRKLKRQETKERKVKEKQQKMDELKQLRDLKRQEIQEKLIKLREITGNSDVGFQVKDLDDDYDPEEHDKRMEALFNDEFYQGDEADQKPEFPDIDEELEIERWDKYTEPHCEDEDFNMDCDAATTSSTEKGKKRKRKSKFAKAVSEAKPVFDPNEKTYEEYLDEYYKLDCEDIIGNIPCRFKYRNVAPNSFGLTIDEILTANDRELNRWCSLKKTIQIRPDHVEKYDQMAFSKKAQNEALKRKILPSLYSQEADGDQKSAKKNVNNNAQASLGSNKNAKKLDKAKVQNNEGNESVQKVEKVEVQSNTNEEVKELENVNVQSNDNKIVTKDDGSIIKRVNKKKKKKKVLVEGQKYTDVTVEAKTGLIGKKRKKVGPNKVVASNEINADVQKPKKVKLNIDKTKNKDASNESSINKRKGKKGKLNIDKTKLEDKKILSDARLQAFGIKPKRFKNKLKYNKVNT